LILINKYLQLSILKQKMAAINIVLNKILNKRGDYICYKYKL